MSPDEKPFLDTIDANPTKAVPRLIYADWLDENGRCDEAATWRARLGSPESYQALPAEDRLQTLIEELELLEQIGVEPPREVYYGGPASRPYPMAPVVAGFVAPRDDGYFDEPRALECLRSPLRPKDRHEPEQRTRRAT